MPAARGSSGPTTTKVMQFSLHHFAIDSKSLTSKAVESNEKIAIYWYGRELHGFIYMIYNIFFSVFFSITL